jgi:hypothetical protein
VLKDWRNRDRDTPVPPLLLRIPKADYNMSDELENLRRVIRLIEEMEACYARLECTLSVSRNAPFAVDVKRAHSGEGK